MSDELVKILRSTYHATTPTKINTISAGQMVAHTAAPSVFYRNPDGPAAADEIERLTAEVRRLDYSTTHTCWDECPRVACAQRREIDALRAQLAEAQQQASKLWALLDDIDTLDDSCRGDDDLFRTLTRAAQLTRHAIMTGEEWDAARADPVRDTLADSDGDDGA